MILIPPILIFPLLTLLSLKPYKEEEKMQQVFGKDQTTVLKGIMVSLVFFHHFGMMIPTNIVSYAYGPAGVLSVSIFFLISGYVTYLEFERKTEERLKVFWRKKIIRLYLPATIFSITYNNFLGGLLWLYLITWIAYRFIKTKYRTLSIIIGNVLFIPFCSLIGLDNYWYNRILAFSVGYLFAKNKKRLEELFSKKTYYVIGLLLSMMLTGITYLLLLFLPGWQYLITAFVHSLVCSVFMIFFLYLLNLRSPLLHFLGNLSWEIFLIHQTVIELLYSATQNLAITMYGSIAITIALAYIIQKECAGYINPLLGKCLRLELKS